MIILKLFLTFAKIGAFSFGGGYAMIPLITREVVEINNWMTPEEFWDIVAIAEMTPGPIAINSATFLGYKVGGFWGAVLSTTGVVFPSFVIILIITSMFIKFQKSEYVQSAFKGIRPAVIGLIATAAFAVGKVSIMDVKSIIIAIITFSLISFTKIHPILAIITAGALGVVLF